MKENGKNLCKTFLPVQNKMLQIIELIKISENE